MDEFRQKLQKLKGIMTHWEIGATDFSYRDAKTRIPVHDILDDLVSLNAELPWRKVPTPYNFLGIVDFEDYQIRITFTPLQFPWEGDYGIVFLKKRGIFKEKVFYDCLFEEIDPTFCPDSRPYKIWRLVQIVTEYGHIDKALS